MTDAMYENSEFFCHDLPTHPLPNLGKILVTGASGYIGGRLVPELLVRGYKVRIMVRGDAFVYQNLWPDVEVVVADALNLNQLKDALRDIDTVYYLIHSLSLGPRAFEAVDIKAARNFHIAVDATGVRRIIYLGGLGDIRSPLSSHLRSRMEIAGALKESKAQLTVLRAAIIIGSGSASYEIIQHLVKELPIMPVPYWAKNRCQPVAIRDVIKYLVGVLEVEETQGKDFDIGGLDILTYQDMLKTLADILHKKIFFVPSFFSNIRFYAYCASLFTPVPNAITQCLMGGLKNEVIVRDDSIKRFLRFEPLSYREALVRAMSREEQDEVATRWSDAYPPANELALKLHELKEISHITHYSIFSSKAASNLFRAVCKIGGKEGWFHSSWMWRLRGMVDRIFLGVGTCRGRKSHSRLRISDVVDFWRVEGLEKNRCLLLRAEMKLPGRAWLEFDIKDEGQRRRLSVVAYYDTNSLLGRIYWYMFLPLHHFIFQHLIEEIEKRS